MSTLTALAYGLVVVWFAASAITVAMFCRPFGPDYWDQVERTEQRFL